MQLTLKLYAGLGEYLPPGAMDNSTCVEIAPATTTAAVLERFRIPREAAHLVLLNGVYVQPEDRASCLLADGDTLAVWPPVAGGCGSRARA